MKSQATPFEKRLLLIILIPGVLGLITAANLSGIGPCALAPIATAQVVQCLLVALTTVGLTVFCGGASRSVPALVHTVPLLMPLVLAAGDLPAERPRLAAALVCMALPWAGLVFLGSRPNLGDHR
ncbi:MAG: hypothetical protein ACO1TE_17375 [Prosthecobacter sp.]